MNTANWDRFQKHLCRYNDLGISLDISRMHFSESLFAEMSEATERAFADMRALEGGEIANPDEGRMVGHYWLRNPELAPADLPTEIRRDLAEVQEVVQKIHSGEIAAPAGSFTRVLLIGIGGSALGPQLIADCLTDHSAPLAISFLDNSDPDGIDRTLAALESELPTTLSVVISKSGGTKETRNAMLETTAAYEAAGLDFGVHAMAVTGPGSKLDSHAETNNWLHRFPMCDWVGGRTSVMSVVGLVPAALQGVDLDALLAGAAAMDKKTRSLPAAENLAMLLALMWYSAGDGKGARDMVVLPYKDRLVLLSKYLQQLVMESLGKEHDLDGNTVNQGIAVYGNKGSTDQHAYVQQLRDGVDNFFATFIEVRRGRDGESMETDPGATTGDYLQGFLRGTRAALSGNERQSMTLSVAKLDAFTLGMLIATFERAVSFYASLVNINAYHQPGVEAGKKAAGSFLELLTQVRDALKEDKQTADQIASALQADPEDVFHCLSHIAANDTGVSTEQGTNPAEDRFWN